MLKIIDDYETTTTTILSLGVITFNRALSSELVLLRNKVRVKLLSIIFTELCPGM